MKPIEPIPMKPTPIKVAHYYRLKRALEKAICLPTDAELRELISHRKGSLDV